MAITLGNSLALVQVFLALFQIGITGYLSYKVLQVSRKQNERSRRETEKPKLTVTETEKLGEIDEAEGQVIRLKYENIGEGDAVNPKPIRVKDTPVGDDNVEANLLTNQFHIENKVRPGETFNLYIDFKEYENLSDFAVMFYSEKKGYFGVAHSKTFIEGDNLFL